jgi:hypothetical protein
VLWPGGCGGGGGSGGSGGCDCCDCCSFLFENSFVSGGRPKTPAKTTALMCPGKTRAKGCNNPKSCQKLHTDDDEYRPSALPLLLPQENDLPSCACVHDETFVGAVPASDLGCARSPQIWMEFKQTVTLPPPSDLARAADMLLRHLVHYEGLRNYRMELLWSDVSKAWTVTIFIDPLYWYDQILPSDRAIKLQVARSWIGKSVPVDPYRDSSIVEVIPPENHNICYYECFSCNKVHPSAKCFSLSQKVIGEQSPCGWFSCGELVIEKLCSPGWIVQARSFDRIREVLLFPRPPKHFDERGKKLEVRSAESWSGHYTNDELVRKPAFWEKARDIVNFLRKFDPEEGSVCVGLNFGAWETQTSKDEYSVACHGHAHIMFSPKIFSALCDKGSGITNLESPGRNPLVGRGGDPEDYGSKNRMELSQRRVVIDGQLAVEDRLDKLESSINSKLSHFEELLKQLLPK